MPPIALFQKISLKQFELDYPDFLPHENIKTAYNSIRLPERATVGSAGYDFFTYFPIHFSGLNREIIIPTGLRAKIDTGWVLSIFPRSGLGFKYGLALSNTVGIIDSDYFFADNEGHIKIKLKADKKDFRIEPGAAFCQGIFLPFGITKDDNAAGIRTGGFGSTTL
ncbi:MAG: deoxyuridine 5'-triphosphate nucleotidohydrolase [Ruminococcus sp.]|jgi:dUTP pyrophosphatase|nr:deoxyuridine 5'-triphosphate nucleotidohydrolase [Ruminococcus sp.]